MNCYNPIRFLRPEKKGFYSWALCACAGAVALTAASLFALRGKPGAASATILRSASEERHVAVLIFKSERRIEFWMRGGGAWHKQRDYPLAYCGGVAGPKLGARDGQVPEGVYALRSAGPPLVVDYPNDFDRAMASADGRRAMGDGFRIDSSAGLLRLETAALQDLSALLAGVDTKNVKIVIAPNDLRSHIPVRSSRPPPKWLNSFYAKLADALREIRG